jgi:hypothetical protein
MYDEILEGTFDAKLNQKTFVRPGEWSIENAVEGARRSL